MSRNKSIFKLPNYIIAGSIAVMFFQEGCVQTTDTPFVISGGSSYSQKGGKANLTNQLYQASLQDESAVNVSNGGILELTNSIIKSTGNSSLLVNSSYYGLNAVILASTGSNLSISNCNITSSGLGATGVFSNGTGSTVKLTNDSIQTFNSGASGVNAAFGGYLSLEDVIIITNLSHSAGISSDHGGGSVDATGVSVTTYGSNSPGLNSIGNITVNNSLIKSNGSEAAILEGTSKISLVNTDLFGSIGLHNWGILFYQDNSGEATGFDGSFTMTGGSINWESINGPVFYASNANATINLREVKINSSSNLLAAASSNIWGKTGGSVLIIASNQDINGKMIGDSSSAIALVLNDTAVFTGSINSGNTAKSASLYILGTNSIWNLSSDSYLSICYDSLGMGGNNIYNIRGNGFNVYYDTAYIENHLLEGKSFQLANGGMLIPGTK